MNEKRREIIIAEIKYWKMSKLLPEKYCDYLLTLYTGGDEDVVETITEKDSIHAREKSSAWNKVFLWAIVGVSIILAMFLLPQFATTLLLVSSLLTIIFFVLAWRKPKTSYDSSAMYYTLAVLMLLFTTLHAWSSYMNDRLAILIGILILNCIVWLWVGRKRQLLYFTIAGFVGLFIVVGFVFFRLGG